METAVILSISSVTKQTKKKGLIHYCKSCQLEYVGRWFAYNPKPKYSETFFLPENEKKVNILDFTLTNTQLQFSNSDLNWDVTI